MVSEVRAKGSRPREADRRAGHGGSGHPAAQHHVATRRPYPLFFYLAQPQFLSVMLVLLPTALWSGDNGIDGSK